MPSLWEIHAAVSGAVADRPAIRWRNQTWTHGQLLERSTRLANVLTDHGLGSHRPRAELQPWESGQDLIGTYLLNGPEYLEVTLGGYGARAVPFNVNYRYVAGELTQLLDDADTAALVYHGRFASTLGEVLPRLRRRPLLLQVADDSEADLLPGALDYESALASASAVLTAQDHHGDDLYVLYTGGTTGLPKGTLWRHDDIWIAAMGGDAYPEASVDEVAAAAASSTGMRFLPVAPFMHGAAQWLALRNIFSGATVVINNVVDHLEPADVWDLVETERVEGMLMVGESFARPLLDELEATPRQVDSLSLVTVGGAATTPATKRRMLDLLPGIIILDAAGATETGTALRSIALGDQVGEAAIFEPSEGCTVLDAERTRVESPGHDEPGWFAKSGLIPLGYLGDEAKTTATFPVIAGVRWSVPGDRARLRADGLVELLGRDSVTINTGGEKVFAEEVEAALLTHPAVQDVLVVGRASERWGQEVVAVVSLRDDQPDPDDDDLLSAAGEHVARFKLPKAVIRVPRVERSPAGKADYRWAQATAEAHRS